LGVNDPGGSLVRAVEAATHRVGTAVVSAFADLALDQAQVHILSLVASSPGLSIGAIHAAFGHRPSTVTDVLDRLEGRGLIARSVNPQDRRSVIVRLTPQGEEAARRIHAFMSEVEAGVVRRVGEEGAAALRKGLEALNATVAEAAPGGPRPGRVAR
jgi:DNA-binding MarR family transcriptional regulator